MPKKRLPRLLTIFLIVIVVALVLPFIIPLNDRGFAPSQLVTDPDGAFVTLQGINIYYEYKGSQDGPVVLLVHGLYGSTQSWRYNVRALVDAGYRVVAFDRPGFGLSDKVESYNYSVKNQADLMAQLLDALNLKTAVIVGHSAGGNVAAYFAALYPERVDKLVLVDTATLFGGPPAFVGTLVGFPPIWRWGRIGLRLYFTRANVENAIRSFQADPAFLTEADFDTYWRAFQTQAWELGLLGLTRDGAVSRLSEAEIRQIKVQTLLLWGAEDKTTPLAQGQQLTSWLPNSELVTLPGAGHQPFEEKAEAFNAALLAFLGR